MNHRFKIILASVSLALSFNAFADGTITGGGGGTTNPDPVPQYAIESTVADYTGLILISWFRYEQHAYNLGSEAEKLKSPFRKVFESKTSIFELIRDSSVEIRSNGPCLDAEGKPWDGSIYASSPNVICLSSYTMAPKLNFANVEAETIALAAHEYSHLLGTNEDEAKAIQQAALNTFTQTKFDTIRFQVDQMAVSFESSDWVGPRWVSNALYYFREFIDNRLSILDQGDLLALDEKITFILSNFDSAKIGFFYVPADLILLSGPNYAKLKIGQYYLCSMDQSIRESKRQACEQKLDLIFRGAESIPSKQFDMEGEGTFCMENPRLCYGADFKNIEIARPKSLADVRARFAEVDLYLLNLKNYFSELATCDHAFGNNNCNKYKEPQRPEQPYQIRGTYNRTSYKAECKGSWNWPHLNHVSCSFQDGPGITPDHDGTYSFEVLNEKEVFPWLCSGEDLNDLECIQPI
jgi:hypothetical protein